jgi:heme-degrading monooxygenase HmoA
MLVRVWQYVVAPGREAEFERLYGGSGAWVQLFARSADYLGTELYRAVDQPDRYLTVDRFSSQEAWQRFLGEHGTDYAELDSRCAALTRSEIDVLG